jgi:hypothetical protein
VLDGPPGFYEFRCWVRHSASTIRIRFSSQLRIVNSDAASTSAGR